jgi:hypothetical protein
MREQHNTDEVLLQFMFVCVCVCVCVFMVEWRLG